MDIIEAIKERHSVRSFNDKPLTDVQRELLLRAIDDTYSPFEADLTIRLKAFDSKGDYKPGTYGVIKNARDYFLLGFGEDDASVLNAGFRFEQVVLKAWQAGLGCCWIAATFKGSDFDKGESWPTGQELRIVCPVGTAANASLTERFTRFALRSANRKPFDKLFFHEDFAHPLSSDNIFSEALEMMRLAPSSTNSQPWRALVAGTSVHFYFKEKSRLSVLDCGIGLCHFWETENCRGHQGLFAFTKDMPSNPKGWKYLISYQRTE